jgi:hypothetical protein
VTIKNVFLEVFTPVPTAFDDAGAIASSHMNHMVASALSDVFTARVKDHLESIIKARQDIHVQRVRIRVELIE